ncbi:hypothetical protein C453_00175 [Haloferax elongans ATCC BAA-1513]|uniref:Uncharacterized protein n=1 Tax=Haloferax elongans ATCC BAA-1513 TaxID=1230453 RepID=M0HYM6_HALEO|nr:hypothetical protein [Haloferax elongans]ELZ89586.1 hypothetical protein C453_00175 [Haloferax elongans ATCC BAA-1513]
MGLKSGSRDAGLDDTDEETQPAETEQESARSVDEETETDNSSASPTETQTTEAHTAETDAVESGSESETKSNSESESESESQSKSQRPTMDSIPYKLRRNKVNEGREQVPYFLREEVIDGEAELQDTLEELLGENVYKSDYREAAMVVAQRNPELIAEILREWGYDLETA